MAKNGSHSKASELIPCMYVKRLEFSKTKRLGGVEGDRTTTTDLSFTQSFLHRLQVHHLTLTFIILNKYTCISTLYLYTYILSNHNAFY